MDNSNLVLYVQRDRLWYQPSAIWYWGYQWARLYSIATIYYAICSFNGKSIFEKNNIIESRYALDSRRRACTRSTMV